MLPGRWLRTNKPACNCSELRSCSGCRVATSWDQCHADNFLPNWFPNGASKQKCFLTALAAFGFGKISMLWSMWPQLLEHPSTPPHKHVVFRRTCVDRRVEQFLLEFGCSTERWISWTCSPRHRVGQSIPVSCSVTHKAGDCRFRHKEQ